MEQSSTTKLSDLEPELRVEIVSPVIPQMREEQVVSAPIPSTSSQQTGSGRKVKRYIHCSDGVYEEYSSDEEGVYQVPLDTTLVDPKTMTWMPWIAHVSSKALAACDYVGETLADFLGITAPKYQYEIEEAKRMKEEDRAEKAAIDLEMAGWNTSQQQLTSESSKSQPPQTSTPISILSTVVPVQSNGPH